MSRVRKGRARRNFSDVMSNTATMEDHATSAPTRGKWDRWNNVLEQQSDKPRAHPLLRRFVVPVVCAVVVAMALVVIMPPFVCSGKRSTLSATRLAIWSLIAGGLCAILTSQGVFARFSKT